MQKLRDNVWLTLFMVVLIALMSFYVGQVTKVVFTHASAIDITTEEALEIIDAGRASHQYFIDHPESIKFPKGNVAYQQRWVDNYNALENLIIRQQNRLTELEKALKIR